MNDLVVISTNEAGLFVVYTQVADMCSTQGRNSKPKVGGDGGHTPYNNDTAN